MTSYILVQRVTIQFKHLKIGQKTAWFVKTAVSSRVKSSANVLYNQVNDRILRIYQDFQKTRLELRVKDALQIPIKLREIQDRRHKSINHTIPTLHTFTGNIFTSYPNEAYNTTRLYKWVRYLNTVSLWGRDDKTAEREMNHNKPKDLEPLKG